MYAPVIMRAMQSTRYLVIPMALILSHPFSAVQHVNKLKKSGGDVGFGLRQANATVVVDDFVR